MCSLKDDLVNVLNSSYSPVVKVLNSIVLFLLLIYCRLFLLKSFFLFLGSFVHDPLEGGEPLD